MNKDENFIKKFKNKSAVKKDKLQNEETNFKKDIIEKIEDNNSDSGFISSIKLILMIGFISLISVFGYSYYQNSSGELLKNEVENYLMSDYFINPYFSKNIKYRLSIGNIWNTITETPKTQSQIIYYLSDYDNSFQKRTYNKNSEEKAIKLDDNILYAKYKIENGQVKQLEFKSSPKFERYQIILADIINSAVNSPNSSPREQDIRLLSNEFGFEYIDGNFHSNNDIVFDKSGNLIEIFGKKVIFKGNKNQDKQKLETTNMVSDTEQMSVYEIKDESEIKHINYKEDKENLQKLIGILNNFPKQNAESYTFTIIIPKETLNSNFFEKDYSFIDYLGIKKLIELAVVFVIVSLIVVVLALFTPITKQNKIPIIRAFNQSFIITRLLIISIVYAFLLMVMAGFEHTKQMDMDSNFKFLERGSSLALNFLLGQGSFYYSLAIPALFFTLLFGYLIIVNLKYIHYKGFVDGFVKKTIIGNILVIILKPIKNIFSNIKKKFSLKKEGFYINFFKSYKRKILFFVLINAFLLFLMMILSFSGFPTVFLITVYGVYMVFVYKYIQSFLSNLALIQQTTQNIAKGKFNSSIDEDLGILSQIAQNINSINKGFNIALQEEIKSQNMKTQLISNVSHDLKTPLTSIINYSDLLKNKDLANAEKDEYIDIIYQKSQRLKILIEDLFEASKASSGNIKLNLEKLDIISLLRQSLAETEEKINENHIEIRLNLPDEKVFCNIDGLRTYRIFSNIIGNITKYTLENTRVYIDFNQSEDEITLEFKNISNYEMDFDEDEIMQRFQRGDKSRTKEGSGLGLAIAKSLIELQGGKIKVSIDADLFKLSASFPKYKDTKNVNTQK